MRRAFTERVTVGLFDRLVDIAEEVILPFSLLSRWVRGRLPFWMALDIFWSAWAPFIFFRRMRGRFSVWRDRAYGGDDEFHPSLFMNVEAMLTMNEAKVTEYLADLARRRQRLHEAGMSRIRGVLHTDDRQVPESRRG